MAYLWIWYTFFVSINFDRSSIAPLRLAWHVAKVESLTLLSNGRRAVIEKHGEGLEYFSIQERRSGMDSCEIRWGTKQTFRPFSSSSKIRRIFRSCNLCKNEVIAMRWFGSGGLDKKLV